MENPPAFPTNEGTCQGDRLGFPDREVLDGLTHLPGKDDPTAPDLTGSANTEVTVGLGERTIPSNRNGGWEGMILDSEDASRDQGSDATDQRRPGEPQPAIASAGEADSFNGERALTIPEGGDRSRYVPLESTGGRRASGIEWSGVEDKGDQARRGSGIDEHVQVLDLRFAGDPAGLGVMSLRLSGSRLRNGAGI